MLTILLMVIVCAHHNTMTHGRTYVCARANHTGCDIVLDGEYRFDDPEQKRRLLGSNNQRILCLTDRYKNCIYWFDIKNGKSVEVNLAEQIVFNGDKI